MAASPVFPTVLVSQAVKFTNADTTVAKPIYTPVGTSGGRIDAIMAAWDDTVAGVFSLYLRRGATSFLLGSCALPARAGELSSQAPINVLQAIGLASSGPPGFILDPYGNSILYVDSSSSLYGKVQTTMTAAKELSVSTFGAEL